MQFHLAPDPTAWCSDTNFSEADDALHDPRHDRNSHNVFTGRGVENIGCLVLLCVCIVGLLCVLPSLAFSILFSDLHVNATGQIPGMGNWGLIDLDTPERNPSFSPCVYNIHGYHDPSETLQLVFSDEFEMDGRSFYEGDDPYWEAVDLHYWQTDNLEWYDPAAITTRNGALGINLTKVDDPSTNHNLSYMGGMISSWNKFCFTGGLIVTNVMLPGINNVFGLWPAVWTMGNLGRAGYGATLDGMVYRPALTRWPYVYDACDVGTTPNQTLNGGPPAALDSGSTENGGTGELSYLPGQRLSRCTCMGESHPGPIHADGTYVGRSAPEIDIFEAQIDGPDGAHVGMVSQSAQWAPFNAGYIWDNSSDNLVIADTTLSQQNSYNGGLFQQATFVVSATNQGCYQLIDQCYAVQGFEYVPGYSDVYITWITDNKVAWTLNSPGLDSLTGISARPITDEPLYILANLGISHAFGYIDFDHLVFPATMRIDWKPTSVYIATYSGAYTNPLLTTWVDDYNQTNPRNNLTDGC
ncbi:glycoside hydrolase family 16 protein [Mycena polygramma]|nr:glycoside hydrolase family 16 protein [Mycena polygramma]